MVDTYYFSLSGSTIIELGDQEKLRIEVYNSSPDDLAICLSDKEETYVCFEEI